MEENVKYILCALAALLSLVSFTPDAVAQRRCGDFISNGTIYVVRERVVVTQRALSAPQAPRQAALSQHAAPVRAAASSCPRAVGVRPVTNKLCRQGDHQLTWRGRSDYCVGKKPSPNSYVCYNAATGRLAWYTP